MALVNSLGQRTEVDSTGQIHGANNRGWEWGYNTSGEVDAATHQHQTTLNRAYAYDSLGNRTSSTEGTGGGAQTTSYTPNTLNQYSSITLPGGGPVAPVHDLDGNLLEDKGVNEHAVVKKYEWDAEWSGLAARDIDHRRACGPKGEGAGGRRPSQNRLTKVRRASDNALLASYAYDPFSRRIRRTTEAAASGGAQDHLFIYDGWNLISEYTPVASSWTYGNRYTWGLDLSGSLQGAGGVGGLLEVKATNGLRLYPFHDGHGNITSYSDMTTGVLGHREPSRVARGEMDEAQRSPQGGGAVRRPHHQYDPFGKIINPSGSFPARFAFSSKPYDPETGFSYYGYLYYDAFTGRWPSRDPIGEEGELNLYAMVGNDAANRADALGLCEVGSYTCTVSGPEEELDGKTDQEILDESKWPAATAAGLLATAVTGPPVLPGGSAIDSGMDVAVTAITNIQTRNLPNAAEAAAALPEIVRREIEIRRMRKTIGRGHSLKWTIKIERCKCFLLFFTRTVTEEKFYRIGPKQMFTPQEIHAGQEAAKKMCPYGSPTN